MELGYALSSEEHAPSTLVDQAARAEAAGMTFALISDHFHPWTDKQGNAPFVWGILGAIAERTTTLRIGTGVTCPTIRMHPTIVAHAAATAAALLRGRFFLGVGTGENLNEHVLGDRWPAAHERREMLEEAVDVMRQLWTGELVKHRGQHYVVDNARLYTLPDGRIDVAVAAGSDETAKLAGQIGDALIATGPDRDLVEAYLDRGGDQKSARYGQVTVCVAATEEDAVHTAHALWPNAALRGPLGQELPLPSHFEQAAEMVSPSDVSEAVICGPDVEPIVEAIEEFSDAGFTHVYLHQVGPDQEIFFRLFEEQLAPRLGKVLASA